MDVATNQKIRYWLSDGALGKFEKNRHILGYIDHEKESRLRSALEEYFFMVKADNPRIPDTGHGIDHHERVREISTVMGLVQGFGYQDIQKVRFASQVHDVSKLVKEGGKGHDWEKAYDVSENMLKKSGIPKEVVSDVMGIVVEHDTDDPLKRGKLVNTLYEADSVDVTYMPRCFQFAQAMNTVKSRTYDMMDKCIGDYKRYQIDASKPKTDLGKAMFEKGKAWAMPALYRLRDIMGDKKISPHFKFLNLSWKENRKESPEFLKETLDEYEKNTPYYEIDLTK